MKITGQYCGVATYHSEYNNYTSFKGLKFKTPKLIADIFVAIEQTLSEFDFFEPIGLCFKYILIFLVGIC